VPGFSQNVIVERAREKAGDDLSNRLHMDLRIMTVIAQLTSRGEEMVVVVHETKDRCCNGVQCT
jgi:hypothetical protein